jgi:hypothetical protein
MFPTLFPFGIGVPKMNNKPIKLTLQIHVKHLMNFLTKLIINFQKNVYFYFLYLT